MPKSKMTTGALRKTLMQAIDDVATGDLTEQKAGAIAKLAAQVNNSLLAEIEIMRAEIVGKVEGRSIGNLAIGEDEPDAEKTIEHQPVPPTPKALAAQTPHVSAPREPTTRKEMMAQTARIIDRRPTPGQSHDFGDPPPGRSALDQDRARKQAEGVP